MRLWGCISRQTFGSEWQLTLLTWTRLFYRCQTMILTNPTRVRRDWPTSQLVCRLDHRRDNHLRRLLDRRITAKASSSSPLVNYWTFDRPISPRWQKRSSSRNEWGSLCLLDLDTYHAKAIESCSSSPQSIERVCLPSDRCVMTDKLECLVRCTSSIRLDNSLLRFEWHLPRSSTVHATRTSTDFDLPSQWRKKTYHRR